MAERAGFKPVLTGPGWVWVLVVVLSALLPASATAADPAYLQLPGVVHVHSNFSSGAYSPEELVRRAALKNIEALILTDHDWVVMEYGLFPFRNLIKRREERKSVIQAGPGAYLDRIAGLNRSQNRVIVIPGVQSSPFYYWSGSPFKDNLVAHDYRKELLIVGMSEADDYLNLPVMHGRFSTRYTSTYWPRFAVFLIALMLGGVLLFRRGTMKRVGGVVVVLSAVGLVDAHPFKSSPYDPYQGDQGIAPYQETIDYANSRNGLVFWTHPESNYAVKGVDLGPVTLKTEHHPGDLLRSDGFTGFSGLYGDTVTAVDPGKHWDRLLRAYCRGLRESPAWAIAGADFHVEKNGDDIDTFQTVFLVKDKTPDSILDAMRRGRLYAVRKKAGARFVLQTFHLRDASGSGRAVAGQTLRTAGAFGVVGLVTASDGGEHQVTVHLIRDGKDWHTLVGRTPLAFEFEEEPLAGPRTYYRLNAESRTLGRLLANPIFAARPGNSQRMVSGRPR